MQMVVALMDDAARQTGSAGWFVDVGAGYGVQAFAAASRGYRCVPFFSMCSCYPVLASSCTRTILVGVITIATTTTLQLQHYNNKHQQQGNSNKIITTTVVFTLRLCPPRLPIIAVINLPGCLPLRLPPAASQR